MTTIYLFTVLQTLSYVFNTSISLFSDVANLPLPEISPIAAIPSSSPTMQPDAAAPGEGGDAGDDDAVAGWTTHCEKASDRLYYCK